MTLRGLCFGVNSSATAIQHPGPGGAFLQSWFGGRFPHFFGETMQMFFGKTGTADLAYPSTGGGFEQYIKPIMMLVRLIGVIAIIRGLVLLSRVGNPQSQPGSTGKALIHIIGGIMAARIGEVISFIKMLIGQGG